MTHFRTTPKVFNNSRELRHNQTEAEAKLWQVLRAHQTNDIHFRRQHAIGNYIIDLDGVMRVVLEALERVG